MTYKDPITPTSYFVLDEDTLVYRNDCLAKTAWNDFYSVLATRSTFRRDGDSVHVQDCKRLREATLTDFDRFRVCPRGHIQEQ